MITVSLCMIVKNEETALARCLDSVAGLVDEIIIVDTGSDDSTIEIAKRYTANVYSFAWIDDFAAARNYSFSKATKDFCMWLDADDVIEEAQQKEFFQMKESLNLKTDMVMMKYHVGFDEIGKPTFSFYRERLLRNDGTHIWQGAVHEAIVPRGVVIYSPAAISHRKIKPADADRNLNIYRKLLAKGVVLEARHQYYYARELYYHAEYREALEALLVFFDMPEGWVENRIEACSIASYCYQQINMPQKALMVLFQSFQYDLPRAEICCDIGKLFMGEEEYYQAIFWYQKALAVRADPYRGGFLLLDCYDYLPYIQLCVCYDQIGDREKARMYNDKAGECKPNAKAYLQNKQYFAACTKGAQDAYDNLVGQPTA